jgi:glyoxylase-like metal-dependent hydrolase (beta-lactamase superfamily II)/rhodanese-related sulfurtransferase
MHIEQIYTGCLAQGAYYITSGNEAAIIDPLREIQPYLDRAKRDGVEIKYIFETHFHADFVSGHVDLAKATGANIVYGPTAKTNFDVHVGAHEEIFELGEIAIKLLHTPGHTMESSCYLLFDEKNKEHCVFTGDTLFIGDVGRPDLAQKAATLTHEELAGMLFTSLRENIMTLPNETIVYPAHGAGSACGKNMSKETVSTIGEQKRTNYALRANMTQDEFIKEVTDGLKPPPAYFPLNVALNKEGYDAIGEVMARGLRKLSVVEFETAANETEALILDTRNPQDFSEGFVPNSINIGINGGFAPWVGALIPDLKQQILLVTETGKEEETVMRLARVGFDYVLGHLEGGFEAWQKADKEVDTIPRYTPEDLQANLNEANAEIIDVRKDSEYANGHISHAKNIALDNINTQLAEFPKDKKLVLHCKGGYRSMIAASILKSRGWDNVLDVIGGFDQIEKLDLPFSKKENV